MQSEAKDNAMIWDPFDIFSYMSVYKYAVIILNRPILLKPHFVLPVWKKALVTVTVDGGTDRWIKYLSEQNIDIYEGRNHKYLPTLITGDMDSASPDVVEDLTKLGSKLIITPNQNETDYTKALRQVQLYSLENDIHLDKLYVFVEPSGRFDHTIGNINTLFKASNTIQIKQIIQISSSCLTWLLKPGFHHINIPSILVDEKTWCALMPFGMPASNVKTTGLKWNLNNAMLQFGGLVSTSNTYDNFISVVTVLTNTPLIWSMGIKPVLENWEYEN